MNQGIDEAPTMQGSCIHFYSSINVREFGSIGILLHFLENTRFDEALNGFLCDHGWRLGKDHLGWGRLEIFEFRSKNWLFTIFVNTIQAFSLSFPG